MANPFQRPAAVASGGNGAPSSGAPIPQQAGTISFASLRGDVDDITTGRITLTMLNLLLLLLVLFYVSTKANQGGS